MKKNKLLSQYFHMSQLRWLVVGILAFCSNVIYACPTGYYLCTVDGVTTCCPIPEISSIANNNTFSWVPGGILAFIVISVLYARRLSHK